MRNLIVLGASALVLALGVAQASAIPTTEQWQEHLDRMNSASSSATLGDFRAQAPDQGYQVQYPQAPALNARGR